MRHEQLQYPGTSNEAGTEPTGSGVPGKRTLTSRLRGGPAPVEEWNAVVGALCIETAPAPRRAARDGDDPFAVHMTGARPGGRGAIQRQDDPGGGVCLDPETLRSELTRIASEAAAVRDAVNPDGDGAAIDARAADRHRGTLRRLTRDTEQLRPHIESCGEVEIRGDLEALLHRVQDTLVSAFQMLAVHHADQTLQAWSGASADDREAQRDQYHAESGVPGMDDLNWCGMFANAQYRDAGMDGALNMAFNSVLDVEQFFTYGSGSPKSPQTIQPRGGPAMPIADYHRQRGSLRSWRERADIGDDIRPGDVVTLDWLGGADDNPDNAAANDLAPRVRDRIDHIAIVRSYTPGTGDAPSILITIDGNAYGATKAGAAAPAFDGTDTMAANATATDADVSTNRYESGTPGFDLADPAPQNTGPGFNRGAMVSTGTDVYRSMTLYGRGRPSVVDFETGHRYPGYSPTATSAGTADRNGPGGPIQRSGDGAVLAPDPDRAFDGATRGAPIEVPYRQEMEARLGTDFGSVQAFAGRDLTALGALAATRGETIAFASPTPDREVVAHELTHVVQNRQGRSSSAAVSDPGDASEHEARAVAAAVAGGGDVAIGGRGSADIHRQEGSQPPPVQPPIVDNYRGGGIDWDDYNYIDMGPLPNGHSPNAIREIYDFYLLRHLPALLPEIVGEYTGTIPAESERGAAAVAARAAAVRNLGRFIVARMQRLLRAEDREAADAIRVRLFAANQHAVVDALRVATSSRYTPTKTDTFCNVYAYDVVTALGGYLPRVWWTQTGLDALQAVPPPQVVSREEFDRRRADGDAGNDNVIHNDLPYTEQLRANGLEEWLDEWGDDFGWTALPGPREAQLAANRGRIVVIAGSTGTDAPGHITVVLAETEWRQRPTEAETNGDYVPLQSQAGSQNFGSNASGEEDIGTTGRSQWWNDPEFVAHGFYVFGGRGHRSRAIQPPERLGTVMPSLPRGGEE